MRKFLILDPNGRYLRGHHYPVTRSLADDLGAHEVTVVIHPKADRAYTFAPGVRVIRWPRQRSISEMLFGAPKEANAQNVRQAKDADIISRMIASCGLGAGDDIIVHSATGTRARGTCEALERLAPENRPNAHFRFLWLDTKADGSPDEDSMKRTAQALNRLPQAHAYAENIETVEHLGTAYGFSNVRPWLIRMMQQPDVDAARPAPEDEFVVGFLASMRREQGPEKVPAIMRELARLVAAGQMPKVRCLVRTAPPPTGIRKFKPHTERFPDDLVAKLAASGVVVERLTGDFDSAGYARLVARSHVLAAPYDTKSYWLRSTGLLIDGIVMARPIVLSPGIAMGDWQDRLDAPRPDTIEDFALALARVAGDHARYASLAKAAQSDMNTEMETVLQDYLGLADQPAAQESKSGAPQ